MGMLAKRGERVRSMIAALGTAMHLLCSHPAQSQTNAQSPMTAPASADTTPMPAPIPVPAAPTPAPAPAVQMPAPTPTVQTPAPAPAAQTPAPPVPPAPSPERGTPATVVDSNEVDGILGKPAKSPTGEDMGRIVDLIIDRSGQIRAAIIDFGGFLGVGSRKIAVDWRAVRFNGTGKADALVLDLTRNQLRMAPAYVPGEPVVVIGPQQPEPKPPLPAPAPEAAPPPKPEAAAPAPAPAPAPSKPPEP